MFFSYKTALSGDFYLPFHIFNLTAPILNSRTVNISSRQARTPRDASRRWSGRRRRSSAHSCPRNRPQGRRRRRRTPTKRKRHYTDYPHSGYSLLHETNNFLHSYRLGCQVLHNYHLYYCISPCLLLCLS